MASSLPAPPPPPSPLFWSQASHTRLRIFVSGEMGVGGVSLLLPEYVFFPLFSTCGVNGKVGGQGGERVSMLPT